LQTKAQTKISILGDWGSRRVLRWGSSCSSGSCQSRSRNRVVTTAPQREGRTSRSQICLLCIMWGG